MSGDADSAADLGTGEQLQSNTGKTEHLIVQVKQQQINKSEARA